MAVTCVDPCSQWRAHDIVPVLHTYIRMNSKSMGTRSYVTPDAWESVTPP